ncbi:MAG: hypothetical protein MI755_16560 [Sphingomonadales bacterium]|nr:hypothetical protein [Sphingomonadales bacterium]
MTQVTDPALPPGPYGYETTSPEGKHLGRGHVYLTDANGRKIACLWGTATEKVALATLVIEAMDRPMTEAERVREACAASIDRWSEALKIGAHGVLGSASSGDFAIQKAQSDLVFAERLEDVAKAIRTLDLSESE